MPNWHLNTNDQILLALIISKVFDWLWEARKHRWEKESKKIAKDDRNIMIEKIDHNTETTVAAVAEVKKSQVNGIEQRLDSLLDRYRRDTCPNLPESVNERESRKKQSKR